MKTKPRTFVDFAALKAAVSITQILEHYGLADQFQQSSSSSEWRGCCPIHGGDNDSEFSVNTEKNIWNCFSDCGRGGNILDFVALIEDVDVHEAALLIDQWFERNLTRRAKSIRRKVAVDSRKASTSESETSDGITQRKARSAAPDKAKDDGVNPPLGFQLKNLEREHHYLVERGISAEAIEEFGIGYCSRGSMAGRIVIPIHNAAGQLLGYIGRWPGDPPEGRSKYKLPAGFKKSLEVLNIHRAKEECRADTPLVIVEGIFDVVALWEKGFPKTVALLGSSLSEAQEKLIIDTFSFRKPIALLFDEDEAGRRGRAESLKRLALHTYVHAVRLPDEGLSPEDLSSEMLAEMLAQ